MAGRSLLHQALLRSLCLRSTIVNRHRGPRNEVAPLLSPSPPLRRRSCPPGDARSRLRATMVTVWRGARGDVGPLMGLLRLCVVIRTRPRTRAQGMVGL
jgi:hypothetical protein